MNFGLQYVAQGKNGPETRTMKVDETLYRKAAENDMTLRQYLKATVTDCDYN